MTECLAHGFSTFAPNVADGKGGTKSLGTAAPEPSNRTIGDRPNVVYGLRLTQAARENPPSRWGGGRMC